MRVRSLTNGVSTPSPQVHHKIRPEPKSNGGAGVIELSAEELNSMGLEDLKELGEELGLDVAGVTDESIIRQRILTQDEDTF